jgi:hypothetical protein
VAKGHKPIRPPLPAPASLTGGAGFRSEDRVGAWFVAALLAGGAPLGTDFGPLSAISFQESPTIQPLDDVLLLSCERPARRFAASIKSLDMLDNGKLEASFVAAAWRRRLAGDFDPESELLGFVSASTGQDAWRSLSKLANYAGGDDPGRLAVRLSERGRFNETDRQLWKSAALPIEVAARTHASASKEASPANEAGLVLFVRTGRLERSSEDARKSRTATARRAPPHRVPWVSPGSTRLAAAARDLLAVELR